ncbi:MAG: hypothetical protein SFU57_00180 [Gemmatimonadales bacterium]|nr:hypothetical protein [Gemmatimonadales bacterium]
MLKVTKRSVLEHADAQAVDFRQLQKAARRLTEKRQALLDPATYSADRIAQHRQELDAEHERTVMPLLLRLRERADQVEGAAEAWSPERRRLEAAIADPSGAAALTARLATVPVRELVHLAREAAAKDNWLLADAVAANRERIIASDSPELVREWSETLAGMGAEETGPALAAARQVGEQYAVATIEAAEASGVSLSNTRRMELALEYPGAMTTGKVA